MGSKITRGAIGVVVVFALAGLVMNWVGDYRTASRSHSSTQQGTSSAESPNGGATTGSDSGDSSNGTDGSAGAAEPSAGQADGQQAIITVEVDGLNFRKEATADARAMRGLKKGEQVTLVEDLGDWYKVTDADGVTGYITSNPSYTTKTE